MRFRFSDVSRIHLAEQGEYVKRVKRWGPATSVGLYGVWGSRSPNFVQDVFFSFQSVLQKSRATKNIFAIPEKAPTSVDI